MKKKFDVIEILRKNNIDYRNIIIKGGHYETYILFQSGNTLNIINNDLYKENVEIFVQSVFYPTESGITIFDIEQTKTLSLSGITDLKNINGKLYVNGINLNRNDILNINNITYTYLGESSVGFSFKIDGDFSSEDLEIWEVALNNTTFNSPFEPYTANYSSYKDIIIVGIFDNTYGDYYKISYDNGDNWIESQFNENSIQSISNKTGMYSICDGIQTIYKSIDSGNTFNIEYDYSPNNSIIFKTSDDIILGSINNGDDSILLYYSGNTWFNKTIPNSFIFNLFFNNESNINMIDFFVQQNKLIIYNYDLNTDIKTELNEINITNSFDIIKYDENKYIIICGTTNNTISIYNTNNYFSSIEFINELNFNWNACSFYYKSNRFYVMSANTFLYSDDFINFNSIDIGFSNFSTYSVSSYNYFENENYIFCWILENGEKKLIRKEI